MDIDPLGARREPVCSYCGHGRDLHDGRVEGERRVDWCRACEARIAGGSPFPMCYWFTEATTVPPASR